MSAEHNAPAAGIHTRYFDERWVVNLGGNHVSGAATVDATNAARDRAAIVGNT